MNLNDLKKVSIFSAKTIVPIVGVGTTNPQAKLDVAGNIRATEICDENGSNCKDISSGWGAGGDIDGITTAAGSGLTGGTASGTATIAVVTDATTVEVNGSNQVQVKDAGITAAKLAANAVTTAKVLDANITTAKIADSNVTAAKIASDAVTSAKILDGTVATADIGNAQITDAKIDTVSVNKITSALGQYLTYNPNGGACALGEVLKKTANGWECGTDAGGITDHGLLGGLTDDDHTQYVMLAGRAGGQNLRGGTAANNNLTLESTSNGTKGFVLMQPNGGGVGIGVSSPEGKLDVRTGSPANGWSEQVARFATNEASNYLGLNIRVEGAANAADRFVEMQVLENNVSSRPLVMQRWGGNVGIGTINPTSKLQVADTDASVNITVLNQSSTSTRYPQFISQNYAGATAGYPGMTLANSRGTASAPTNVTTGQVLGSMNFTGRGTSLNVNGASIIATAAQNFSDSAAGSDLILYTTPIGSTSLQPRMTIYRDGNVGIGTSTPVSPLTVNGVIESQAGGIKFPDGSIQVTSATSGTNNTMISNWPDFIVCSGTNGTVAMHLSYRNSSGLARYTSGFTSSSATENLGLVFNSNGSYNSAYNGAGWTNYYTNCENQSITQLYSAGQAINIAKGPAAQWLQAGSDAYYNAGLVGIGTSSPTASLHVRGALPTSLNLDSTGTSSYVAFLAGGTPRGYVGYSSTGAGGLSFLDSTGIVANLLVTNSGQIGIGTTAPMNKLEVKDGDISLGAWSTTASTRYVGLPSAAGSFGDGVGGASIYFENKGSSNQAIGFKTHNFGVDHNTRMYINHNGFVGIGTTNPSQNLDVSGQAVVRNQLTVLAGSNSSNASFIVNNSANSVNHLYVRGDGNVGIGTSSPGAKLHVSGSVAANNFYGGVGTTASALSFASDDGFANGFQAWGATSPNPNALILQTAGAERLRVNGSGNVGIGSSNPVAKLDVGGQIRASTSTTAVYGVSTGGNYGVHGESVGNYGVYGRSLNYGYAGVLGYDHTLSYYGILGFNGASGAWAFYGAGSAYVSGTYQGSDRRLKDNITPLKSGLDIINQLAPVSFNWKNNSEQRLSFKGKDYGFIAQDVEKILPEVVREIESPNNLPGSKDKKKTLNQELGKFKTVEYTRFIPWLAQAIKELFAKFTTFEVKTDKRLKALEAQNELLAQQLKEVQKQNELIQKQLKELQNKSDRKPSSSVNSK